MTNINEAEFRLITMGFGATLDEVDAACRDRCARAGTPCFADRPQRQGAEAQRQRL